MDHLLQQVVYDTDRIANSLSSKEWYNTSIVGVIAGWILGLLTSLCISVYEGRKREKRALAQRAESIRFQYAQLLPRLEKFSVDLLDFKNNKPSIDSLAWIGVKGNLLLHRAHSDELIKKLDKLVSYDSILKSSSNLNQNDYDMIKKLLDESIADCEFILRLTPDETTKRFK